MATWTQRSIGSAVIDSLTAGKIVTGVLQAGTIIHVGDPAATHTEIGQGAVRVMRPDSDGEIVPTISLGGAERDVVQIVDPDTGATLAGLGDDGSVVGLSVAADALTVGGAKIGDPYDPDDVLWSFARGAVGVRNAAISESAGASAVGVLEASQQVQGGRLYRVTFSGTLNFPNVGDRRAYLTLLRTLNGVAPTVSAGGNNAIINSATLNFPTTDGAQSQFTTISGFVDVGADPGLWYTLRVLAAIARPTSGSVRVLAGTWPAVLLIEDLGPQGQSFLGQGQASVGGGTPAGTSTPIPPPAVETRDYVKTYNASWGRTWRESGNVRTDVGPDLVQGRAATSGATRNYAAIGFPAQVGGDLAGATVSKIEVYLYAHHWWGRSGTALIGVHDESSLPSTFTYSGAHPVGGWKRGEGKWVTLPTAWYPAFASGVNKGITLGGGATTAAAYYGKINGYGTPRGPKLRVTYTN